MSRCVVIGVGSVGVDMVDVDAATAAGIVVTNTPDIFIEEVADHALALILACARRVVEQHHLVTERALARGAAPAVGAAPPLGADPRARLLRQRGPGHGPAGGAVRRAPAWPTTPSCPS